jgi:hypothetical protein
MGTGDPNARLVMTGFRSGHLDKDGTEPALSRSPGHKGAYACPAMTQGRLKI